MPEKCDSNIRIIIENDYIDHHYLEDYAQYFVRCFRKYSRDCSRIHFFDCDTLDALSFRELLNNEAGELSVEKMQNGYLGNVVVRPLPNTFLAKVCLRPYKEFKENSECRVLLKKEYKASIFGVKLTVESVAFQEQDRVLSACATSALWSFLHAHRCISLNHIPSAISITKSAYPESLGQESQFPNSGLSFEMMARSVKANGLEPRVISLSPDDQDATRGKSSTIVDFENEFLEQVFAYCGGLHPVVLGVSVYSRKQSENEWEEAPKGLHAVTVLGFNINLDNSSREYQAGSLKLRAHRIDRFYIHDDRIGPFARLEKDANGWKIGLDVAGSLGVEHPDELYKPTELIIGVYHKTRITYKRIKDTCTSFYKRSIDAIQHLDTEVNEAQKGLAEIFLSYVNALEWEIKILEVQSFKERVRGSKYLNPSREEILTLNLPKYIWSAKALNSRGDEFELMFDATDIPQGNSFLGAICYNSDAEAFMKIFKEYCKDHSLQIYKGDVFDGMNSDHLWGMVSYFTKEETYRESLDGQFGRLKGPKKIKPEETENHSVVSQDAVVIHGSDQAIELDQNQAYIWLIDEDGALVIGKDDNPTQPTGHPTLIKGGLGRIGGELNFVGDVWLIDSKSGRYSYSYTVDQQNQFLENVKRRRFECFFRGNIVFQLGKQKQG